MRRIKVKYSSLLALSIAVLPDQGHLLKAEELMVQSAAIMHLQNRLGHQQINSIAGNGDSGMGAPIVQRIRAMSINTTIGATTINDVSFRGVSTGAAIVQNYEVGNTSTKVGWIRVNTVKSYGISGPTAVVQDFRAGSLRSSGWPIIINTYIY